MSTYQDGSPGPVDGGDDHGDPGADSEHGPEHEWVLRVAVQEAVLALRPEARSPLLDVVGAGVEECPGRPHSGHHGGRQGGDHQARLDLGQEWLYTTPGQEWLYCTRAARGYMRCGYMWDMVGYTRLHEVTTSLAMFAP